MGLDKKLYINIDNIKHNIVKHGKYIAVDVDQMTDHHTDYNLFVCLIYTQTLLKILEF